MKAFLSLAFSSFCLFAFSQITLESRIETATVFQQGAQLTRTASASLPKGESVLIFSSLPRELDPNSIILGGNGRLDVLSIRHQANPSKNLEDHPSLEGVHNKLESLRLRLEAIASEEHGLVLEREVLEENKKLGGTGSFTLNELKATADFARQRRERNAREWYALQNEKKELQEKQAHLLKEKQELLQKLKRTSGEVYVKVVTENAINARFRLSYIVPNAHWRSVYDAKVNDLSQPVKLTHKANITQNTGEDWKNVNLVLATGNPSASAQVPYMATWYVNLHNVSLTGGNPPTLRNANTIRQFEAAADDAESFNPPQTTINQNLTQQEYTIERKQTLLSSNTPVTVALRALELPARYEYHAKPRLDKDAFLVAKVHGWNKYDLLDGDISLFNNNTYVGKAYLNTQLPQDTLQLSLGRDKGLVISRERVYTKQEKTFFGSNRIDHYVWRIELRNNKKQAVDIVLRDQVPVSQNDEIKVSVKSVGGGEYDEPSGIIKWRFPLAPAQQKAYEVSYEVKYPKEVRVMYY